MLRAIRIYLSLILLGNLVWEALQLPLYTIWQTGTPSQKAFAAIHCAGGDFLIATTALVLALMTVGHRDWPISHFNRVAAVAITLGLGYAAFSEWLNVSVRGTWTYSALMPVLSLAGWKVGLSPLLQWSIVPTVCFVVTRHFTQLRRT
jgi:hypothetical protein